MNRYFISGTGTDVGKTHITAAIARHLARRGKCLAIKPFETGVVQDNSTTTDAARLLEAAPSGIDLPPFFRHTKPVAPFDATFDDSEALTQLCAAEQDTRALTTRWKHDLLIEGAGGIAVPLRRGGHQEPHILTVADFVATLQLPLILIAPNQLGVQSHTITAAEFARNRGLEIAWVLLNSGMSTPSDISQETNRRTLELALKCPVISVPALSTDLDEAATTIAALELFD